MNRALLYKIAAGAAGLLVLIVLIFWLRISSFAGEAMVVPAEGKTYTVSSGHGLIKVARSLQEQGVISDAGKFVWYARLTGGADDIKAGEYDLAAGMTPADLFEQLLEGRVKQYPLTIIEGWNFKQLREALEALPKVQHSLKGLSNQAVMAKLGFEGEHPEGRFLPDTYLFPAGSRDVDILLRAHEAQQQVLAAEWAKRAPDLPYKTPYEALIMASIVEKETGVTTEREQIAGVFVRRLNKRMRLQTDPTVIYGMGDKYKGNIRRRDLKQDTPYNTYTRRGLPPTPIAMAGQPAIYAALHPDDGETLYFVAKGDGSHYFSTTVAEHNRAVRKYQLRRTKNYRSAPKQGS